MRSPLVQARLPREFYNRQTDVVARDLLGKALIRRWNDQWLGGWIVETEAYLPCDDASSHSHRGRTASNAAMFMKPGTLYVYPIHAKYCLNAVTECEGRGSAVLIRAIEPVWGVDHIAQHRKLNDPRRWTRGPAMLCQALAVDRKLDQIDLVTDENITIVSGVEITRVTTSPRIGISTATDLPLRFFVDGNRFVSGRAGDHRARPNESLTHYTAD
ncbi:MAG: DNA-3-methyladenine glycosylase [Planctomycetota bacterium]